MSKTKHQIFIISLALFFESYILPILFAGSIYSLLGFFVENYSAIPVIFRKIFFGELTHKYLVLASLVISKFFFVILYSLCLLGLLIHKPVESKPDRYRELIFPLVGTFFYLFYQWLKYVPESLNFYLIPQAWLLPSLIIGTVLTTIGFIISIVAVFHLRHSFAIFVEARGLVTKGSYNWVRHPLYLGYIILNLGISIIIPRFLYFVVSGLLIWVTVYRAILEEQKIIATYPEYKDYMAQVPFLFPFGKRKQ